MFDEGSQLIDTGLRAIGWDEVVRELPCEVNFGPLNELGQFLEEIVLEDRSNGLLFGREEIPHDLLSPHQRHTGVRIQDHLE